MAGKTTLAILVLAVVAAAALMEGAAAKVYVVGDATSWTIPTGGAAFYSNWAANHTFAVGDILSKLFLLLFFLSFVILHLLYPKGLVEEEDGCLPKGEDVVVLFRFPLHLF